MSLDPTFIFVSLVFSTIGFGYFRYGKKAEKGMPRIAGILLMIYPIFFRTVLPVVAVGTLLLALPWIVNRLQGY